MLAAAAACRRLRVLRRPAEPRAAGPAAACAGGSPPPPLDAGAVLDFRVAILGVPTTWRLIVREWDPPHRFVDALVRGPFARWEHRHRFVEGPEHEAAGGRPGTWVEDRVTYRFAGGPLGRALDALGAERARRGGVRPPPRAAARAAGLGGGWQLDAERLQPRPHAVRQQADPGEVRDHRGVHVPPEVLPEHRVVVRAPPPRAGSVCTSAICAGVKPMSR